MLDDAKHLKLWQELIILRNYVKRTYAAVQEERDAFARADLGKQGADSVERRLTKLIEDYK